MTISHDAVTDDQTKAGASAHGFGRKKRLEQVCLDVQRNAGTIVHDFNDQLIILNACANGSEIIKAQGIREPVFTAIAPSPTPEVTPLAKRCRTSPATNPVDKHHKKQNYGSVPDQQFIDFTHCILGGSILWMPNFIFVDLVIRSTHSIGHGLTLQISLAYSEMVRSLENFPEAATFKIALRVQPSESAYNSTSF